MRACVREEDGREVRTWHARQQYLAPHFEQQQNAGPLGSSALSQSARWQFARHNPGGARAVAFSPAT